MPKVTLTSREVLKQAIGCCQAGQLDKSAALCRAVLNVNPDYFGANFLLGIVQGRLDQWQEALASYEKALAVRPDSVQALVNVGTVLRRLNRLQPALASYEKALAIEPNHVGALNGLASTALDVCDWTRTPKIAAQIVQDLTAKGPVVFPFSLLVYCDDPRLQLEASKNYVATEVAHAASVYDGPRHSHARHSPERIRIAYLSAEFCRHPTVYLAAELFELHDRSRFEVIGVSFGADDRSELRARLVSAFDSFHDVRPKDDKTIAELLRELEVDIAVDLMGHTRNARPGILACRTAPIQVNYLGYPATMGADFIDYIIADPVVLPMDQQRFYTEKIVHLPESYQANDTKRKIAIPAPTRQQMGLPDSGFVFCCFNKNYKITPPIFDIWMRLLAVVENSVLWLLWSNRQAEANLRREASARGIDPARLVFASPVEPEQHLARHKLADLFLDTLPYNAHTTASDALWSGLPLITCIGKSFAGRVASSLLSAIDLPELVTKSLPEYEALALKLATDPSLLQSLRRRLEQNRSTHPLFNSERFRRHIEAAYDTMWRLYQDGEAPRSFRVPAI